MAIKNNTTKLQEILNKVSNLPEADSGGVNLPSLDNEATSEELFLGKELIDDEGNIIEGTFTIDNELSTQDNLIAQIQYALQGKAIGEGTAEDVTAETNAYTAKLVSLESAVTALESELAGKAAGGEQVTPEITINSANGLITATAGSKTSTYQLSTQAAKTITPSTSAQTAVESGKYITGAITVAAMPTATQATPSITIDSNGLITATTTQTAGYVIAGTKSTTKQLAFQAAKTITPGTTDQTAVAAGYYTGGAVTVQGDSNLIAGNIKSGISIFGVNGTFVGSGSGSSSSEDEKAILEGTIVNYTNSTITKLRTCAFMYCTTIKTIDLPACETIGQSAFVGCTLLSKASFNTCTSIASSAFQGCVKLATVSFPMCKSVYWAGFSGCTSLTNVDLPQCTYLGGRAFQNCTKLATINLPLCKYIYSSTFQYCSSLATISLPNISTIGSTAFGNCTKLSTIYLLGSTVCTLSGSNAFTSTGIGSTKGSIFVPASLVDAYKAATNWTYFANRIFSIEEAEV